MPFRSCRRLTVATLLLEHTREKPSTPLHCLEQLLVAGLYEPWEACRLASSGKTMIPGIHKVAPP